MQHSVIESLIGALVVAVAAGFLWFGYGVSNRQVGGSYYAVTAQFHRIDGVDSGTEVRISGVRVGSVESLALDPASYLAQVTLAIQTRYQLPSDSTLEVSTDGLLGGRYLNISPGGANEMIPPGGRLTHTQGPVDVVQLLGRFVFGAVQSGAPSKTSP